MKSQPIKIERRIRLAGILLIAGLLVELVTLRWSHPTAFLFFLLLGGALMALTCLYRKQAAGRVVFLSKCGILPNHLSPFTRDQALSAGTSIASRRY
jgi:hypothetical protein